MRKGTNGNTRFDQDLGHGLISQDGSSGPLGTQWCAQLVLVLGGGGIGEREVFELVLGGLLILLLADDDVR